MNRNGYATIVTCLLIPIVLLGLGLLSFSILKTRHKQEIQNECRGQYHQYFTQIRSHILAIESLNPLAIALHNAQLAMLPLLWYPPVLKAYQTLLRTRQKLEKIQTSLIAGFNRLAALKAYAVIAQLQRTLQTENLKIKNVLTHGSSTDFRFSSKLQIVKRINTTFPPYDRADDIDKKQRFSFNINNQIQPRSWMVLFKIQNLAERYSCAATLATGLNHKLEIDYTI